MSDHAQTTVVAADAWDRCLPEDSIEPWFASALLRGHAEPLGWTPLLLHARASYWEAWYPLLLRQVEPGGIRLARTPPFGGPHLRCRADRGDTAAHAARRTFARCLDELGVASEFYSLSPWLPFFPAIRSAWRADNRHPIVLAELASGEATLRSPKLVAELRRLATRIEVTWRPFGSTGQAREFAAAYEQTMTMAAAPPSAARPVSYFESLASRCGPLLREARAVGASGGATHLFARTAAGAHYLYSARWGQATGCAGLALATAQDELARSGRCMLNLGGGTTAHPGDSLLAFKGRFADRCGWMSFGAIVYRPGQHADAVLEGQARPVPSHSQRWSRGDLHAACTG